MSSQGGHMSGQGGEDPDNQERHKPLKDINSESGHLGKPTAYYVHISVREGARSMTHVPYTELRQNLARYLDEAIASRTPITITRQGGKADVVLLSAEEFDGWMETVHLLRSPTNAQRLLRSIATADAGEAKAHDIGPTG
jgi:antitoxin YefM